MNVPWRNLEGPAKLLAICVVVLLVASGLCGLQWMIFVGGMGGNGDSGLMNVFISLGILELTAMAASVVIAVGTLIVWGLKTAFNRSQPDGETTKSGGQSSDPQTLFPRENPPHDSESK
jgi:hypothetical protein